MAEMSIGEAASAGFASRATIYRNLADGSLSSRKKPDGKVVLEASELVRLYGEPSRQRQKRETKQQDERQSSSSVEVVLMRERLETLQKDLFRLETELREAKEREQWLKDQVDKQIKLLEDHTKKPPGKRLFGLFR